jgi:hypothetical protein
LGCMVGSNRAGQGVGFGPCRSSLPPCVSARKARIDNPHEQVQATGRFTSRDDHEPSGKSLGIAQGRGQPEEPVADDQSDFGRSFDGLTVLPAKAP